MTLQLCAIPVGHLVNCCFCGTLSPPTSAGETVCVKCSVNFSLSTEPYLEEEDDATTYIATNEYGDSNYCPTIDASYEELTEEEESPVDGTGGTLVEPKRRLARSIYDKLMAIYPLERQPIPVAPRCTETCIEFRRVRRCRHKKGPKSILSPGGIGTLGDHP